MRPALRAEWERLERVLRALGQPVDPAPGVRPEALAELERAFGLTLDPDLRDLYLFSRGSKSGTPWFCVQTDELELCALMPPEEALELANVPERAVEDEDRIEWKGGTLNSDPRIAPYLAHPRWLPFAEANGLSTAAMLDGAPGPKGTPGQLIAFQHDPDAMYFLAGSFLEFLAASTALYEQRGAELIDEPDEDDDDEDGDGDGDD